MLGVDHIIGVGTSLDAGIDKELRVLPDDRGVNGTMDKQEASLEVGSTQGEVCLLIAFGVFLRAIHIAFAVHDLVASPVGDSTASDTYLEDFGVCEHQVRSHEATIAPACDPDTVGIDIGEGLEEVHALHLVCHLVLTEVAMDDLLKGSTTVRRATTVDGEDDEALRSHIKVPAKATSVEAVLHELCVWAIVDVDDGRILLRWIEVRRLQQAVVQVGHAIGSLDRAEGDLWIDEVCFGILRLVQRSECLTRGDCDETVLRRVL